MRRWLHFLPWAAAISVAAFAAAATFVGALDTLRPIFGNARHPPTVATILPFALGACLAAGVPLAIWFRASRGWAAALFLVIVATVVLVVVSQVEKFFHGANGEAAGWMMAIAIFYIVPAGLLVLLPALSSLAFVGLPAGALLLFLSGEMTAIRRGVSVLDLSRGRLRVGLLLLVTVVPPAVYCLNLIF
jgi:hypothetical protein